MTLVADDGILEAIRITTEYQVSEPALEVIFDLERFYISNERLLFDSPQKLRCPASAVEKNGFDVSKIIR